MPATLHIPILILLVLFNRGLLARTPLNRTQSHPPVVLITIDTLRADHLGCYGYNKIQTPTIDALARDGVLFDRALSQVPLTWPSHAAILTGTYPFQNGVQDFTAPPLSHSVRSIAQAFKVAGYHTGAVVSSFVLDRSWGLARGFDYYDDAFSVKAFQQRDLGLVERKADETVSHALAWLEHYSNSPFFLWIHLYDPHRPYDPPEPFRTEYRDHLYDGEIAYADRELGRLISWLKQRNLYGRTLLVLMSDHGESLGEHGETEHGFFVYNSTLRVPLIVKAPAGSMFRHLRIDCPVETIAVTPTLLQLAGLHDKIEGQFQTLSLTESARSLSNSAYSETFYPFSSFGWSPLRSIESGRYHYVDAPHAELYDELADPTEKNNIIAKEPAILSVLREKLKQLEAHNPFVRTAETNFDLRPIDREKLQALGYFGFRAPVPDELLKASLPDPKDKIYEFNTILNAQDAFHDGDDTKAEALLQLLQKHDPAMYVIPFMLGESALRRQDWQEAADKLRSCLMLNPNFDNAMTGLAHALAKLGHVEEARTWLQKALQLNGENYRAWYEIGLLEAQARPAVALSAYEKSAGIQPNYAPVQRDLGLALFEVKQYAVATSHLERAIALGLDDAHIRNFLGICYSQTRRPHKAIQSYLSAIKLDPQLAEAHLNLAYELRHAGRLKDARNEYTMACRLEVSFCGSR